MRRTACLLLLAFLPGCLLAAVGGGILIGESISKTAATDAQRKQYIVEAKRRGLSDAEIRAEIAQYFPDWHREITFYEEREKAREADRAAAREGARYP